MEKEKLKKRGERRKEKGRNWGRGKANERRKLGWNEKMMNRPNVKKRRGRKLKSRKRSPDRKCRGEKRTGKQQQERSDKENWGNHHVGVIGKWRGRREISREKKTERGEKNWKRGRREGVKENWKTRKETVTFSFCGVCGCVCSRHFVKDLASVVAGVSISKKAYFVMFEEEIM